MTFKCETCGEVDMILVDGYAVGDRLLEGVMFKVTHDDEGEVVVNVTEESAHYFNGLNEKKWLKEMKDYVDDGMDVCAECSQCGQQLLLNTMDEREPPIRLPLTSVEGLMTEDDIINPRDQQPL